MARPVTKPKKRIIAAALLGILLLAGGVCALQMHNAVSLRGAARMADYVRTDGTQEGLVPLTDDPRADRGILHISGALLRPGREVGAVYLRVALLPETLAEGNPAQAEGTAILLNTQMVRRADYAAAYGCDDHCGFYATAKVDSLPAGEYQYRVLLADETDGVKRMVDTGMTVVPIEGGLAFARVNPPEEEAQENE